MGNKWRFIASVFQLVIGILAIVSFVVLWVNGEMMGRWIPTLILAIAFTVLGSVGIFFDKK